MKHKDVSSVFLLVGCLVLSCVPLHGQDLNLSEKEMIRQECLNMLAEVNLLKSLQVQQKEDLMSWKNRCSKLEQQLQSALQMLQNSKSTVIELQKLIEELKIQLEELKHLYTELCGSLSLAEKKNKFWKTTAIVMICTAITEGIVIFFKNY